MEYNAVDSFEKINDHIKTLSKDEQREVEEVVKRLDSIKETYGMTGVLGILWSSAKINVVAQLKVLEEANERAKNDRND